MAVVDNLEPNNYVNRIVYNVLQSYIINDVKARSIARDVYHR